MTVRTEPGTPLTDRELVVVRLVAMGRTNADIAGQLFISVETVHAHLRDVYVKTGTSDRTQLTRWLWADG